MHVGGSQIEAFMNSVAMNTGDSGIYILSTGLLGQRPAQRGCGLNPCAAQCLAHPRHHFCYPDGLACFQKTSVAENIDTANARGGCKLGLSLPASGVL